MEHKINQPKIFNIDLFEKSLDKIYMDLVYMEAKIDLMKREILEMKDLLDLEKDLWQYNG